MTQAKVTVPAIRERKNAAKLKMITAYDTPTARIADRAGADIILVGDTLAQVVLGYEDTLPATIEIMIHHTAAVARAKPNALIVGDMPWLSYHISIEESVRNAGRLIRQGGADCVKLEGGRKRLPVVRAILDAEIPVMGHLGLTPQSIHAMGGYRVQGKRFDAARELLEDARALADAGIFALVLEGVPDVLGMHNDHLARFVRQYAHLADTATEALQQFFADIQSGAFPSDAETYHTDEESARLLRDFMKNED